VFVCKRWNNDATWWLIYSTEKYGHNNINKY